MDDSVDLELGLIEEEITPIPPPKQFTKHGKNNDAYLDGVASEHEEYLQDNFQETIVRDIFDELVDYIGSLALPLCEFMTHEDIEEILDIINV
jgi:hypothetical protein